MGRNQEFRPQDVLVLASLIVNKEKSWRQIDLANELGLSQTEISFSLDRLYAFGLTFSDKKAVKKDAAYEFLGTAIKYLYPPKYEGIARGLPTGASADPLSAGLTKSEEIVIWESELGLIKGQALRPIYLTIPTAANKNKQLYKLLTVIDALRTSHGRVLELSKKYLKEFIYG